MKSVFILPHSSIRRKQASFVAVAAAAASVVVAGLFLLLVVFIIGKHIKICVVKFYTRTQKRHRFNFSRVSFPLRVISALTVCCCFFASIIRIGRAQQELKLCTPAVTLHCVIFVVVAVALFGL